MQKIMKGVNRTAIFFWIIVIWHLGFVLKVYSQQVSENINKIRTVVIDPGHGGKDSGAPGSKSFEKDIALAISLKAGKYIEEKIPDVKVVYTRKTDVSVKLFERAKIANDNDADLFISVHVNASENPLASGTESLVLGLHRANENFEVAKRENQVILLEDNYKVNYEGFDPNSEESYIMFNLMQFVYDEQSIRLADAVQYQFRERANRKDRGVHRQGLLVLAQSAMPGILIETGFISNKNEEEFLLSENGQDYIASAIFRAFRDYKQQMEGTVEQPLVEKPENDYKETISTLPTDTQKTIQPTIQKIFPETIAAQTPKIDAYSPTIVYKVQIMFSENKINLNDKIFKDFNDVEEIVAEGKYKYVVGSKNTYNEALEYSKWVKNRYPDAFIVAVSNGKIIPLSEILKEN